jgi:DNA-binding transcriptional LysR family regulator
MRLTDVGQAYYEECRQALALLESAERHLTSRQIVPHGTVRLSAPTTQMRILPFVADWAARHPKVRVEVDISNRNVDFIAEGFDMAIRAGELGDSTMVARKLQDASLGVFASPDYLARRTKPKAVADLDHHALIGFVRPSTGRVLPWLFRERGAPFEIAPRASLRVSGDFRGCIALARAGAGLVQAYHDLVADDLVSGALVEVLRPFAGRSRPFTLLTPSGPIPTLAARSFADELVAFCRSEAHPRRRSTGRR